MSPNAMLLTAVLWLAAAVSAPTLVASAGAVSQAAASQVPDVRPSIGVPAARLTPRMDAQLDDPAWAGAPTIPSLGLCVGPEAAGMSALPTTVSLLWSPNALYVRFVCHGGDLYAPHGVQRNAPHYQGDVAEVFLDPVGDAREFLEMEVSPANGILGVLHLITTTPVSGPDGVLTDQIIGRNMWDQVGWDLPGLQTATQPLVAAGKTVGWVADFAFPAAPTLKRLGAAKWTPGMSLRANFIRYDQLPVSGSTHRRMVAMNWSPVAWGRPHRSPQAMGYLHLLPLPKSK